MYLHEVLNEWFEYEVKPQLQGRAFEVRHGDDAVLVFEHEDDARRVLGVVERELAEHVGLGAGLVIKRVEALAAGGRLHLASAHPDYPAYERPASEVHVVGKILWPIRRIR